MREPFKALERSSAIGIVAVLIYNSLIWDPTTDVESMRVLYYHLHTLLHQSVCHLSHPVHDQSRRLWKQINSLIRQLL